MSEREKPFIPRWLNEFPLTPTEFRVYANLVSRADWKTGVCWPSAKKIAADCRIKRDTVFASLLALEAKGLLTRERATGTSNRYRVLVPKEESSPQTGLPLPPQTGLPLPPQTGLHPSPETGLKVIPVKVLQGSETNGVREKLSPFVLTEEEEKRTRQDFGIGKEQLAEVVRIYSECKGQYVKKDGPLSAAGLRGWARTTEVGRAAVGAWGQFDGAF